MGLSTTKMEGKVVLVKVFVKTMGQWYAELSYS